VTEEPDTPTELDARARELAERLSTDRPVPAAGFRGALGRHLVARDSGYGPRPARLRLLATGYLVAGMLLLALGALTALGAS
jgi:hypothetical protein